MGDAEIQPGTRGTCPQYPQEAVVEIALPVAQEILAAFGLQILGQVEIASSVLPFFLLVLLLTCQPAKLA